MAHRISTSRSALSPEPASSEKAARVEANLSSAVGRQRLGSDVSMGGSTLVRASAAPTPTCQVTCVNRTSVSMSDVKRDLHHRVDTAPVAFLNKRQFGSAPPGEGFGVRVMTRREPSVRAEALARVLREIPCEPQWFAGLSQARRLASVGISVGRLSWRPAEL